MNFLKTTLTIILLFTAIVLWSQNSRIPLIGETAPSFIGSTTNGILSFPKDYGNKWKILFSHPGDFTPVCTSEILELAMMQQEFKDLGVEIAVISADNLVLHNAWVKSMNNVKINDKYPIKINFPLIDDNDLNISRQYGMVSPYADPSRTIRGVFIIDSQNKIQAIFFYPKNIGRNLEEIKRTVIALQISEEHNVLTPVNWIPGDAVLLQYPYPYDYYDSTKNTEYNTMNWYMLFKNLDNKK